MDTEQQQDNKQSWKREREKKREPTPAKDDAFDQPQIATTKNKQHQIRRTHGGWRTTEPRSPRREKNRSNTWQLLLSLSSLSLSALPSLEDGSSSEQEDFVIVSENLTLLKIFSTPICSL
jgi:hypothetical protein